MTDFSYQLYSSRNSPPLSATFAMLKDLGYRQVEGFGGLYTDNAAVAGLRGLLDETGLEMRSGHFGLDQIEGDVDHVVNVARTLGMTHIFCPHLAADQRPGDAAGYVEFGKRLYAAGAPFRDAGFAFGWHNHDFEFEPLADGSLPMERMFEGAPDLTWEADIAWVVMGGGDPLDWIARHGDRIAAVHVKDIAPTGECVDEDGWADIGEGTMDWAGLMAALRKTPAELFVMEHDNPGDAARFARRSIAAAKTY